MLEHFADECFVSCVVGEAWMGKAEVRAMHDLYLPNTVSSQHRVTNHEFVFVSDEEVILHARMYAWQRYRDHPMRADTHRFGRYEMRVVWIAEQWRFDRMRLVASGEYGGVRIGEQLGRPWLPVF